MPAFRRISDTKTRIYVTGGPELARALQRLDAVVIKKAAKDAIMAGGYEVAVEWASRVPIGHPPEDDHPGAYREAMLADDAVRARATGTGATGKVAPALLGGIPVNQQPWLYASVLEFGDETRAPFPSARAAADAARDDYANKVADVLREAIH